MAMRTAIVLFTRDLRVHDNPALAASCRAAERVVPLFVRDPSVRSSPNRDRFLAECLADLRSSLRDRGGDLVIRDGDPVAEALRLAGEVEATGVALAADASRYAQRRQERLDSECARQGVALKLFPGVAVVAPGEVRPGGGGDHYKVFSPYHRAWQAAERRPLAPAPRTVTVPDGLAVGRLPAVGRGSSPEVAEGGETAGRQRLADWLTDAGAYPDHHDDLPGDRTSRLSPYLHFGCVSPAEVAERAAGHEAFVRQLCWRDFYQQVLHARPDLPDKPYRDVPERWRDDEAALRAWTAGQTGVPVVDAGMRQLAVEGWMHNRARLITAAFLTKHLGLDWRAGGDHFMRLLLDADVGNNFGNWQWVAGTGNDTRPYRRFNPIRQAERFDPDGEYVRRYVPELAKIDGPAVHRPWLHGLDYPPPLDGVEPTRWLDEARGSVSTKRAPGSAGS